MPKPENELTLEDNQFLYSLLDGAAKTLGLQHRAQFQRCAEIGDKLAAIIKEQNEQKTD